MNKSEILKIIQTKLSEKIDNLERLIAETRSSNNETKSSMGDKYETTREMVQQEINNLQIQLNENVKAKNSLKFLNSNPHEIVGSGSLVETDKGLFYIAVSLGEINFEGRKIFLISPESPLAKVLIGKKKEQEISLNNNKQVIQNLW
jgi:transcription elongation GreA/GreB family factor